MPKTKGDGFVNRALIAVLAALVAAVCAITAFGGAYAHRFYDEPVYELADGWTALNASGAPVEAAFPLPVPPEGLELRLLFPSLDLRLDTPCLQLIGSGLSIRAELDGALLYERAAKTYPFSTTDGVALTYIRLPATYAGGELVLRVKPVLDFAETLAAPRIGSKASMLYGFLREEAPIALLSALMLILGAGMGAIQIYLRLSKKGDEPRQISLQMCAFSMAFALFVLFQTHLFSLFFPNLYLKALLTYLVMSFLPIPFLQLYRENMDPRYGGPALLAIVLALINFFAQLLLSFFRDVELRYLLPCTHAVIALSIAACLYAAIRTNGRRFAEKNRLLAASAPALAGAFIDCARYYLGAPGSATLCFALGTFAFILLRVGSFAREYVNGLEAVIHAQVYREMAYTDLLTRLKNRNAYEAFLADGAQSGAADLYCAVADINNLKCTNDAHGHAVGDGLIMNAARLMAEAFRGRGEVFRTGGDEFVALFHAPDQAVAQNALTRLRAAIDEYNARGDLRIDLALGLAGYDPARDRALIDLVKRADQCMYAEKQRKKARA